MNYTEVRENWRFALKDIYEDEEEIDNLFYLTCYYVKEWGINRVVFEKETPLSEEDTKEFDNILKPLKTHRPIQYIIGHVDFYHLNFHVDEDVLIPRPETEELVDIIVKDYMGKRNMNVLDIGTGSGCIAISLAKNLIHAEVFAMDKSASALTVAKLNAEQLKVNLNTMEADILEMAESAGDIPFDIIVSNPPYILHEEAKDMRLNVLSFEPHLALFVEGEDPLQFYYAITEFASNNMNKDGKLYLETNEKYANDVAILLEEHGFRDVIIKKDLQNKPRFVIGNWKGE